MPKTCNLKFDDSQEIFKFDKVAKQTNGSVLFSLKNCVMLGAVVSELDNSQNERWTPLTVQYIEKTYANAKINGGYLKREGKPSDFETLTSRVIDRSLRPLFPDGYSHPTTITVMVLSVDDEVDLQTMAVNCASASLFQSDIPINKAVCAIRVGKINDKLVLNPTNSQLKTSTIDLFLSGVDDELLMIEMMSNSSVDFIEADIENFVKIHNTNEIDDDS
ncbi:MAG: polyribonucleotide nucleotidyltransferase, partial [Campylobacteraceae bacterium 4484_166]